MDVFNNDPILNEFLAFPDREEGEILSDDEIAPSDTGNESPDENCEIVAAFYESREGGKKLLYDRYDYHYRYIDTTGSEIFYCAQKNKFRCKAKLAFNEGNRMFTLKVRHNHKGDKSAEKLELELFKRGLYRTIEMSPHVKTRNLIADRLPSLSHEAMTMLTPSRKRSIENHLSRKKKSVNIFEPDDFDELSPALLMQIVDNNEEMIFNQKIYEPSHMIVFATTSNLWILEHCTVWSIDATFKAVPLPHLFSQILVVAGLCRGRFLPLVYVLMSSKSTNDYLRILDSLPMNNVSVILTDFEMALINAIKISIENRHLNVLIKGCRFHFGHALLKRLKKMGLLTEYLQRGDLYSLIRPLFMLPFVPSDRIFYCFLRCRRELLTSRPELAEFTRYMSKVWIGKFNRTGRWIKPRYDNSLWNVYELILAGLPTTNNSIESLHRVFKDSLSMTHPPLANYLATLIREHALVDYYLEQEERANIESPYFNIVASFYAYVDILYYMYDLVAIDLL